MSTPGFVVDGKVISSGKLLIVDEIVDILKENNANHFKIQQSKRREK